MNLLEQIRQWLPTTSKTFVQSVDLLLTEQRQNIQEIEAHLVQQNQAILQAVNRLCDILEKESKPSMEILTQQVEGNSKTIEGLQPWLEHLSAEGQQELLDALREMSEPYVERLKTILAEARYCHRNLKPRPIYLNLTERAALADSFGKVMQDGAVFEKKFQALIHGLDAESRGNVIRILTRMHQILDHNTKGLDLYTEQEKEDLLKLRDEFNAKILKISDSLFCYDKYLLPVDQFDSSVFYSRYGMDLIRSTQRIAEGDVIDAGGYVGDTALLFSPMTQHNVYVFEAAPENCALIQKTISMNALQNIVLENLALGAEHRVMPFSLGERSSCNTLVERPGYVYPSKIDVEVVTLDSYVQEHGLTVGLIKIDVEGGEQLILQGALETIRRFRPVLLISIYHSAGDFFDIKPMLENLQLGYTFKVFKPINNAIAMETVLIAECD